MMINGTGLYPGIRHPEGFYDPVNHTVKMHFSDVRIMGMDDPVGFIDLFDAIEGADACINGNTPVNWSDAPSFSIKILIEPKLLDLLLGFPEAQSHPTEKTDVFDPGSLLNHILYSSNQFSLGFSPQQEEAVMGGQDVNGIGRLDHGHVHIFKRGLCLLPNGL